MTMLVSLADAKAHLRIDTDADDLTLKIMAASGAVMNYLKDGTALFTDANGDVIEDVDGVATGVPFEVVAATLLMTGYLYKQRDEDEDKEFETGYLPRPVTALLYPLRDPALS